MSTQAPVRSLVDRRITATVKAFLAGRGLRPVDVAPTLGISVTSLYNKLKGASPWTATEVASLADLFGISVSDLYSGLSGTFAEATGTWAEQEGTWADRARPKGFEPPTSCFGVNRRLVLVEAA